MRKRIRGSGRVFWRGNRAWIAYYVEGAEHREPGGNTEAEAQALLIERLAAIGRGVPVTAEAGRLTVKDAIDNWIGAQEERKAKGLPQARSKTSHLLELLGHVKIARLTPELIRKQYTAARRAATIQDGTIRGELLILSAAINLLRKEHRLVYVPFIPKPAASPARQGYPEPEVLASILPHVDGDAYRDAIAYADATARRKSEVLGLLWTQVFQRDGEIRMGETKNGDPITIPIEGAVAAVLDRRAKDRRLACLHVFHDAGRPLDPRTMLRRLQAACVAAGTAVHLVHDLRRSGVRNLIRAGVDEHVAMSISGHRDRNVFRRYNVTSVDDQRAALRRVDVYRAERLNTDKKADTGRI